MPAPSINALPRLSLDIPYDDALRLAAFDRIGADGETVRWMGVQSPDLAIASAIAGFGKPFYGFRSGDSLHNVSEAAFLLSAFCMVGFFVLLFWTPTFGPMSPITGNLLLSSLVFMILSAPLASAARYRLDKTTKRALRELGDPSLYALTPNHLYVFDVVGDRISCNRIAIEGASRDYLKGSIAMSSGNSKIDVRHVYGIARLAAMLGVVPSTPDRGVLKPRLRAIA